MGATDPRKLVRWSNYTAWPGVAILFLCVPQVRTMGGATSTIVLLVSIAMIIGGAVMGQIGKSRLKRGE